MCLTNYLQKLQTMFGNHTPPIKHWKMIWFCKSGRKMFIMIFRFEQYALVKVVKYFPFHKYWRWATIFSGVVLESLEICIVILSYQWQPLCRVIGITKNPRCHSRVIPRTINIHINLYIIFYIKQLSPKPEDHTVTPEPLRLRSLPSHLWGALQPEKQHGQETARQSKSYILRSLHRSR